MATEAPGNTPSEVLSRIPTDAALLLRDYIKGLEAEAGTARAELVATRAALESDLARLQIYAANLREQLVAKDAELAQARADSGRVGASVRRLRSWL